MALAFRKPASQHSQTELGRADATKPHLRIPAEYHRRPREQRKTGDSGKGRSRTGWIQGRQSVGRKEKVEEEARWREARGRIRKRVHRLGRLFVPVSYVLYPGPYLFQPHRCTLALGTPLSPLRLPRPSRNSSK